jgi:hypothetical protein
MTQNQTLCVLCGVFQESLPSLTAQLSLAKVAQSWRIFGNKISYN